MPNTTKVVRIGSGEVMDAVVTEWGFVWGTENLKEDGGNLPNRYSEGRMAEGGNPSLRNFALFDSQREAQAQLIRDHITSLQAQVAQVEQSLLALYAAGKE